jgi:hypothetical protein
MPTSPTTRSTRSESFGQTSWQSKRTKALEDWLFPILTARGFLPHRLRTRFECDAVYGFTGSAYSDKTSAAKDTTEDDLNLATIFTTAGSDALYHRLYGALPRAVRADGGHRRHGSVHPLGGLLERQLGSPDGAGRHDADGGKTFSGGGSVTWLLPMDWMVRAVNGSTRYYWAKVTVSATPTSAKAGQLGVIRASSLRAPATFRTLQLIFPGSPDRWRWAVARQSRLLPTGSGCGPAAGALDLRRGIRLRRE